MRAMLTTARLKRVAGRVERVWTANLIEEAQDSLFALLLFTSVYGMFLLLYFMAKRQDDINEHGRLADIGRLVLAGSEAQHEEEALLEFASGGVAASRGTWRFVVYSQ